MRTKTLLLACSLLAVGLAGCVTPPADAPAPPDGAIPFETVDEGQNSGIAERQEVVVREQGTWTQLWDAHAGDEGDPAPAPEINFSDEMVIAVFKGQSSNACHGAEITNLTGDEATETIVVHGSFYEVTGAMCAEVITHPFHIVKLDHYAGDVVFQMDEEERPVEDDDEADDEAGDGQDGDEADGQGDEQDENPQGEPVAFETVDQGQQSGIEERSERVVTDEESWAALWANHTERQQPPPDRPAVDFSNHTVIGVFKGQSPDGCHGAEIQNVTDTGDELTVEGEYVEVEGMACTQAVTYPFHIVTVPIAGANASFQMQETTRQA